MMDTSTSASEIRMAGYTRAETVLRFNVAMIFAYST